MSSEAKRVDPVLSDQGGRLTACDPGNSPHTAVEDSIRQRAYEIYEQRGAQDGHAEEDWFQAQSQIADLSGSR
jgi:hypothetical protein